MYQGDLIKLDDLSFRYNTRQKLILTKVSLEFLKMHHIEILVANSKNT